MSIEDRDEEERVPPWRRIGTALAVAAVGGLLAYGLYRLASGEAVVAKKVVPDVVQMRLVSPPPPPPPPDRPPPPQQKMQEVEQRETPIEKVPPTPALNNEAPPGPLALDAPGQGPGDSFGLGGRPGGSGLNGGGGGGGQAGYGWYAMLVEGRIQERLQREKLLRGTRYTAAVSLWVGPDGTPLKIELIQSTGHHDIDQSLSMLLQKMPKLPQPPQDLPQPIVLQVSSS